MTRVSRRWIRGVGEWPAFWDTRGTRFGAKTETVVREKLLGSAQSFECYYCERTFPRAAATLEHIIPLSRGGTYERENLSLACGRCNTTRNRLVCDILAGKADRWKSNNACVLKGIVHRDGRWYFERPKRAA